MRAESDLGGVLDKARRVKNMLKEQIVEFCGMKLKGCHIFGAVDTNKSNTEKILETIKAL